MIIGTLLFLAGFLANYYHVIHPNGNNYQIKENY